MTQVVVWPHDQKSMGARSLTEALGINRLLHHNSTFKGAANKIVINWGSGACPDEVLKCRVINKQDAVNAAADKLQFFHKMATHGGGRIPTWTNMKDEVVNWLRNGKLVVARTKTRAKGGAGIVFFDNIQEFAAAPLYTIYVQKKEEYRVHFAFGQIIDVQRKVLRKVDDQGQTIDPKKVDWRIRNAANGFIFIRGGIAPHPDVTIQAMKCAVASGLDFGAADVIWNEAQQKAYVLEINTAPGLEGQTIESYVKAFKEHLGI